MHVYTLTLNLSLTLTLTLTHCLFVADTVYRTDALLRDGRWKASRHQHRRGVPPAWLERYGKLATPLGSDQALL